MKRRSYLINLSKIVYLAQRQSNSSGKSYAIRAGQGRLFYGVAQMQMQRLAEALDAFQSAQEYFLSRKELWDGTAGSLSAEVHLFHESVCEAQNARHGKPGRRLMNWHNSIETNLQPGTSGTGRHDDPCLSRGAGSQLRETGAY